MTTKESVTVFHGWAGFSDDRLHMTPIDDGWGGRNLRLSPSIFMSRAKAKKQYEDVRKIKIVLHVGKEGK